MSVGMADDGDVVARGRGKLAAFHDLTMDAITGEPLSFEKYKGQACLVVNLASQ